MNQTFVEALTTAKRKAKLSGRPLSTTETRAISEGYFSDAATKLAEQKRLQLQQEGLQQEKELQYANLAQQKELEQQRIDLAKQQAEDERKAADEAKDRDRRSTIGTTVGGVAGWAVGAEIGSVGGPLGMAVGAAIGGLIGGGCLIVSTCTNPYSYEVNVTRLYRDTCLDSITLTGYYFIAALVVPIIKRVPLLRKAVKKFLVDRLVDAGEYALCLTDKKKFRTSEFVANNFLKLCFKLGKFLNKKLGLRRV